MKENNNELIYSLLIKSFTQGELSYQINPDLTLGIDPRNDIILTSPSVSLQHLVFKENSGQLMLTHLGQDNTTRLNGQELKKNQNYLLNPDDIIKIDQYTIRIILKPGVRYESTKNRNPLEIAAAQESKSGINFLNTNTKEDILFERKSIKNPPKKSDFKKTTKEVLKKSLYVFSLSRIVYLIIGLFFDFLFAYFLLSQLPKTTIHIYFFYSMLEIGFFTIFKASLFQRLLSSKIHRNFTVWILIILFLIFPLFKESFTKVIKQVNFAKTTLIDIHGKDLETQSLKNTLSLQTALDNQFFLIEGIEKGKFSLSFYDQISKEAITAKLVRVDEVDILNSYFNRTHPFRIPQKSILKSAELIKIYKQSININSSNFKEILLKHGLFISYVNDTKSYFIKGLGLNLEQVNLGSNSPIILIRDQSEANLYFISSKNIFQFKYQRPKDKNLEDLFTEKVLANIYETLIKKQGTEIGFLEMFDSLPKNNYQVLLTLFEQNLPKIKAINQSELTNLYRQSLDEVISEIEKESRNVGPSLVEKFEEIRNKLN